MELEPNGLQSVDVTNTKNAFHPNEFVFIVNSLEELGVCNGYGNAIIVENATIGFAFISWMCTITFHAHTTTTNKNTIKHGRKRKNVLFQNNTTKLRENDEFTWML